MPGGKTEGVRGWAPHPLTVSMAFRCVRQGTRRFVTPTDSAAEARSTVEALTFRAVTRTLLFDQTWQSSVSERSGPFYR
jgi:hypothetical protein